MEHFAGFYSEYVYFLMLTTSESIMNISMG